MAGTPTNIECPLLDLIEHSWPGTVRSTPAGRRPGRTPDGDEPHDVGHRQGGETLARMQIRSGSSAMGPIWPTSERWVSSAPLGARWCPMCRTGRRCQSAGRGGRATTPAAEPARRRSDLDRQRGGPRITHDVVASRRRASAG